MIFGGVTAFFGWHLQYLSFDFEFEKFFPQNDPDSQFYEIHKREFGYDNDFILVILGSKNGLFNSDFLTRANHFENSLRSIPGIEQVTSPLSQSHLVNGPTGLLAFPLIHLDNPDLLISDSTRIFSNEFYASSFSSDRKSLIIFLEHDHFTDQERSQKLVEAIQDQSEIHLFDSIRLVGKLTAQNVFISYIQQDFAKFLIGSIILSFLILVIIFRSLSASILPFLISVFSLVWLFGFIGLLGVKINLLSSLLPPILFFVSMSDAIHLMNAVYRSKADNIYERIKDALSVVLIPTLLTSVTTAVGFLSLIWINTEPIQILGVFAALGVLAAFIITFTFGLWLGLFLPVGRSKIKVNVPPTYVSWLTNNRRMIGIGAVVIILIAIPGLSKLRINSFLLDDLPPSSEVRRNFEFADEYLGGSKPYEVRIEAKAPFKIWDREVMDEIRKVETYLKTNYVIGRVQGPSSLLHYLNMANNGGLSINYQYPEKDPGFRRAVNLTRRLDQRALDNLILTDQSACRIVGFFPELGSYETNIRNEKLLAYLKKSIDHSKIDYRITGTTFLIDKSHELLSTNLIKGLITAIGIIGVVLGIYFKSFKLLLISLIPNIIPLVLVAGVLGWLGVSLKMTTSIIFTVAFGIAVDDTIHMMSYYMQNKEKDGISSLKLTFNHAGSAILITSIIVVSGFSLFLFSSFGATYYLGLFVSLSLLIALFIDLTVLPLFLLTIKKKQ